MYLSEVAPPERNVVILHCFFLDNFTPLLILEQTSSLPGVVGHLGRQVSELTHPPYSLSYFS